MRIKSLISAKTLLAICILFSGHISFAQKNERANDPKLPASPELTLPIGREANTKLDAILDKPVSLAAEKMPLEHVLAKLGSQVEAPLVVDRNGIVAVFGAIDREVTVTFEDTPLRRALDQLLGDHDLGYSIRTGMILITTKEALESIFFTQLYPAGDLVVIKTSGGMIFTDDNLAESIRQTVVTETWEEHGGESTISFAPQGLTFIVRAPENVHRELYQFFADLRVARKRGNELAKNLMLPSVDEITAAYFGKQFAAEGDLVPALSHLKAIGDEAKGAPANAQALTRQIADQALLIAQKALKIATYVEHEIDELKAELEK